MTIEGNYVLYVYSDVDFQELKEQTEVLSGARDEILHTLKSNKQHSGNEITQLQSSKADLESRVNRLSKELEVSRLIENVSFRENIDNKTQCK